MIREQVERFFGEESPLRRGMLEGRPFRYEMRPQQVEMALAVADALDGSENLCVEAPTGVGKTFAYLVPSAPTPSICRSKSLERTFPFWNAC